MDVIEAMKTRRAVRRYQDNPVPDEDLREILEAANRAPSAGNLQGYEIFVVRDEDTRRLLTEAAYGQRPILDAPLCLVFFANGERSAGRYGDRGRELYCIQDASVAAAYAQLAAVEKGLDTVWIGAFDDGAVSAIFPDATRLRPVSIMPVGYAAETPGGTSRRRLNDIVHGL